jgi:hypothetical protein
MNVLIPSASHLNGNFDEDYQETTALALSRYAVDI